MSTIVRQLSEVERAILVRRLSEFKTAERAWNEALMLAQHGDAKTRVNLDAGVVERVDDEA